MKEETSPNVKALETRNQLGLSSHEPIDIFRALKYKQNISLVFLPFKGESKISGMFLKKDKVKLILINTEKTLGHQIFTAAHEFYHIKYSLGREGGACRAGVFDQNAVEEFRADQFAVNLLLPKEGLEFYIEKRFGEKALEMEDIIELENYFNVSHQCMVWRLQEINRFAKITADFFKEGVKNEAKMLGFSTKLYEPTYGNETMSDVPKKIKKAREKGLISKGKAKEFLLNFGYFEIAEGFLDHEFLD